MLLNLIFGITGLIGSAIAIWQLIVYLQSRKKSVLSEHDVKVILEELDRRGVISYVGGLTEAPKAIRSLFDDGLLLMKVFKWDEAIVQFKKALTKAYGTELVALYNFIGQCHYTGTN